MSCSDNPLVIDDRTTTLSHSAVSQKNIDFHLPWMTKFILFHYNSIIGEIF